MSQEQIHEPPPPNALAAEPAAAAPAPAGISLSAYAARIDDQEQLTELILKVGAVAEGEAVNRADDALVRLVSETGLNLDDRSAVRRAVLVFGERAAGLRATRAAAAMSPEPGDLRGLAAALLRVLEVTRLADPPPGQRERWFQAAAAEALAVFRARRPPEDAAEARWWEAAAESTRLRLVPAYTNAAANVERFEDHPLGGLLLRSHLAMGTFAACLGLLSVPMPVSTPLVCLGLALLGSQVLHRLLVRQVASPLLEVRDALAAEARGIARSVRDQPWTAEDAALGAVLDVLLPLLEGERLAGRGDSESLRRAVRGWFVASADRLKQSGRSERYLQHLQGFCEGRLVNALARQGAARERLGQSPLGAVLDHPWASALLLCLFTLPFSWIASRISPFPQGVDFPLMVALFAALGFSLPRLISGTQPARLALEDHFRGLSDDLDPLT